MSEGVPLATEKIGQPLADVSTRLRGEWPEGPRGGEFEGKRSPLRQLR